MCKNKLSYSFCVVVFLVLGVLFPIRGSEIEVEDHLLQSGYKKIDIRHAAKYQEIQYAVICKPKGSAIRRSFIEIVQLIDGNWEIILKTDVNTTDVSALLKGETLIMVDRFSDELVFSMDIRYLLRSNKLTLDAMERARIKRTD